MKRTKKNTILFLRNNKKFSYISLLIKSFNVTRENAMDHIATIIRDLESEIPVDAFRPRKLGNR